MDEIDKTNSSDQTKFRLHEITKIENYFNQEINQTKLCIKKLSQYVAAFDYIDKVAIVLSATTGGFCIFSRATVVGAPAGIASARFTIVFSLNTGIIKKLLSVTRNQIKSTRKFLCWLKVNSIALKL